MPVRSSLFFAIALFNFAPLCAQRIENVRAVSAGDRIIITYDINNAAEGQKFKLLLYSSIDNYTSPLLQVKGDVGMDVELNSGSGKTIEWDPKAELKDFSGEVTFEVRGDVVATALSIQNPLPGVKYKLGKSLNMDWKGGRVGEQVALELIKGGIAVSSIAQTSNTGHYAWTIPKNIKKGRDYQVKITGNGSAATSQTFTIKKRTSLVVKLLPIAAAGALIYFLLPDKKEELPPPPNPN